MKTSTSRSRSKIYNDFTRGAGFTASRGACQHRTAWESRASSGRGCVDSRVKSQGGPVNADRNMRLSLAAALHGLTVSIQTLVVLVVTAPEGSVTYAESC